MKQVKKVLSFALALILLVTACYTNGLGVSAGVNANGETEIDVTKVYSGHNDQIVTFVLSESDYSQSTKWLGTRSEEYNFWTNIQVYTSETEYVTLKDAHTNQKYYRIWDRQNTLSIQLKPETYNDATKIVIPAGTVFPSYDYDSNGSTTKGGYVTTTDLEFIKPADLVPEKFGQGTPWIKTIPATEAETNVKNIHARGGNKLLFFLSNEDYTSKGYKVATPDKIKEYDQLLDKIEIYTSDTECTTLAGALLKTGAIHYNVWGENGSIAFDLKSGWDATKISKVVVKAGCQFPSYEYTENGETVKTAYTVKADTTFTRNSIINENECISWTRKAAPVETPTGIEKIEVRDTSARLLIYPTVSDYENSGNTNTLTLTKIKEYNLLDMVEVYNSEGTSKTLRELCLEENQNYYNIWGSSPCVALDMPDKDWNGSVVKKIVFKAGCQFPSHSYTHGGSYDNVAYTLQEDLVYVTNTSGEVNNSDWTLVDNPEDITVTGVKSGHNNQIVTFTLSNSDYVKQEDIQYDTTAYNFWDEIKLYTSDSEPTSLKDAYTNGKQAYLNMWGSGNSVSIEIDSGIYEKLVSIEIPAGTVFPSRAYNSGASQKKGGFKTTTDITFVKPEGAEENPPTGYAWTVYEEPANIETTISKIQVRGEAGQSSYLFVFLGNNDYADVAPNTAAGDKIAEYEFLSKIELSTETETKPLSEVITTEKTYNRYEETGSISFGLKPGWNGTTIKRITFKQGTEFPSYRYTNGSATSKKAYVLPEDITYTTPVSEWSNEQWYEYYEPVTYSTKITNIHVRKGFVLLFLSNHDYEGIQQESFWSKLDAYNLTDMITVTTADGTKKLRHILDSTNQAYYNIWEDTDCVAIKMDTEYNGETIKKVAIKKGAEFPSYTYTSGGTEAKTSYVTEKDYVFNTSTSADENTSWTQVTPYSSETDVSGVTVVDGKLTFTLSKNDYTSDTAGNSHTEFDYWKNVRVYTSDTEYVLLSAWGDSASATYDNNTLSVTGSGDVVRVVIPAKTVFPSYKYTSGKIAECVGYYVAGEKVFEKQNDGTWKDVSTGVSKVSGDVNGDGNVNSQDIVAMAKYTKNKYRYNASSLTYDEKENAAGNRHIVRRVILGDVLHNYEKESDSLTYFSSSDMELDSFLNDFYKRQVGYNDYVEGDMTVNSYKPGTIYSSIYNLPWLTKSLLWVDSKNSLESDRTAQLKKQIESVIVDRYGYVWNGDDAVEDPTLGIGKKHGMGWPFPNAAHAGGAGNSANVRYWELSAEDTVSKWTSSLTDASFSNGLYQGTANSTTRVTFTVKDDGSSPIIRKTSCAPWLCFELRMNGVTNPTNIKDIYVTWKSSTTALGTTTLHTVKAGDIAAVNYDFTENYEHVLYLPMYTETGWNGKYIKEITIEIRGHDAFSGTFALNYVRPSFDTRHSNNNANYIEALKEYYNMTGDVGFVEANITKARKAMNFYLQMYYNTTEKLNDQSYLYGHGGSRTALETGLGNGYWDILYTPQYDFQSNMYFYQALKDLSYLEGVLSTNDVSVSDPATIDTATTSGKDTSPYSKTASELDAIADAVVGKMRTYFWNKETERFMAGYDNSGNKVDYGYTTWNLQAIELGIATKDQKASIMSWIDGSRTVLVDNEKTDIYKYSFAPRTATVDDKRSSSNASGIYGAFIANGGNNTVKDQAFGESLQFGGAVMYSSYYDLTSRIQVNGADDALKRLKGIQTWYDDVSNYFNNNNVANDEFYFRYFLSEKINPQNGSKEGYGNGAVGIDGEFTESLLVASAIPYGFFGMDSEGGNTLCVTPSLPKTMDHWKVENMQYNGVTYDLSIYKDAVRIDSVRGNAEGLKVKVTLDCPAGKDIYVDGVAKNVTRVDGKATVTVPFGQTLVEVK